MRRCCTSGAAGEAAGSTDRATTAKPMGMVGRVVSDLAATRNCVSASSFIARDGFGARPAAEWLAASMAGGGRGWMEVGWWHGWRWALRVSNLRAVREVQRALLANAENSERWPLKDAGYVENTQPTDVYALLRSE